MTSRNNRRNKGSSSRGRNLSSSSFEVTSLGPYSRSFQWKISNLPHVNNRCIFSNYFHLDVFRFRFLLFPKGQAASRNKHLSLQLEVDKDSFTKRSCFISSRVTLVNHVDASNSLETPIIYRFTSKNPSICNLEITELDSLHDPERGLLLNGTDLHLHGNVFYLHEHVSYGMIRVYSELEQRRLSGNAASTSYAPPKNFPYEYEGKMSSDHVLKVPFEDQLRLLDAADASASDASIESLPGVYEGQVIWELYNSSFFEDIITFGMLRSPSFKVGPCHYSVLAGAPSEMNEEDQLGMAMLLEPLADTEGAFRGEVANLNAWFVSGIRVRCLDLNITKSVCERIGGWIGVTNMTEFKSSYEGRKQGILAFFLKFYAFLDRDFVYRNMANSKTIWNFGEGPKSKVADKEFVHYTWEIQNIFSIEDVISSSPAAMRIEKIKGRTIRLEGANFNLVIYPSGDANHQSHLGAYLAVDPVTAGHELDILVHFRFAALNQKHSGRTITREQIFRFGLPGKPYGFSELIPISSFMDESAGYIVRGKAKFEAYIYVLEEAYDDKHVVPSQLFRGPEILRVRWRVDNFLAWEGIPGAVAIPSKMLNVNGCILRIVFYVDKDRIVYGTLSYPRPLVGDGEIYFVSYQIGLMKQKNRTDINSSDFKADEDCFTNARTISPIGPLSDILKQNTEYILNDKVALFCNFYQCTRLQ